MTISISPLATVPQPAPSAPRPASTPATAAAEVVPARPLEAQVTALAAASDAPAGAAAAPLFIDMLRGAAAEDRLASGDAEVVEDDTAAQNVLALPEAIEPAQVMLAPGFPTAAQVVPGEAPVGRALQDAVSAIAVARELSPAPQAAISDTPAAATVAIAARDLHAEPGVGGTPSAAREKSGAELVVPTGGGERPAAAASPSAAVPPPLAAHAGAGLERGASGEVAMLKLPNGPATEWRQPLLHALGERLQVEVGRGGERAVIRLDPPMMGSVEIVIRHEGGSLQVHLSATHGEVLRQLQSIGESLRQDLVHRQYADVSVQVSDGSQDAGGRQRRGQGGDEERDPGRALADAESDRSAFTLNRDQE